MKKILMIGVVIALLLLSPVFYLIYAFTLKGPVSDDVFQNMLPAIVNSLEVKIEGEGKETIVFIHGYPDSLELWDKQAAYFKQNYTVVRFTLPGFELEDNGKRSHYTIQQMRIIIDTFIKELGRGPVTVMAHDWGAVYASHYLKEHDLVNRLVLFDIGSFGDEERPAINVKYTLALAIAWTLPDSLGSRLAYYTADKILQIERVDPDKSIDDLRPDARLTYPYWHLWRSVLSKNSTEAIAVEDYGTPFLFMYGKDKEVWFHAESWAQQVQELGKGQIEVVPGGHWFMQSSPDLVNQKLADWLLIQQQ
ncbi:alpha/beta fold hydrolase [Alkalimonas mucilaginosa]|uniref:Alpha/beta hydrolase n=1 Tax=Alkalimonas mucilaginosa TaxID=3057676 RepID=A0ABU7JCY5_9GAMM|nr:alpha/beta hydrolase [Alkalimonas sp. MEB004]MEE2023552.1 alpha/beta hydrolase [Alkalimonas sp. MEB004]